MIPEKKFHHQMRVSFLRFAGTQRVFQDGCPNRLLQAKVKVVPITNVSNADVQGRSPLGYYLAEVVVLKLTMNVPLVVGTILRNLTRL